MLKPKLRVHGANKRIRAVAAGDTVFIIRSLPNVPLDSISPFPAPMIVRIDESGTGKRGQTFRFKVQFQTRERSTHVGYFFSRHLRATKKVFGIGTKVVVRAQLPGVVVPVGTEGTVVGGDGNTYHITFFLELFEPPITVSQDGVPADAVCLPGQKDREDAAEETEEAEEGEEGEQEEDKEQQQEGSESDGGEAAEETLAETKADAEQDEGQVEKLQGGHHQVLAPHLRDALAAHLQPEQVDLLCAYLQTLGVGNVTDALTLQGYLTQYLRQAKESGGGASPAQLPASHMIALKEAGASDEELTKFARDGVTGKLTVAAALKRYEKIKT